MRTFILLPSLIAVIILTACTASQTNGYLEAIPSSEVSSQPRELVLQILPPDDDRPAVEDWGEWHCLVPFDFDGGISRFDGPGLPASERNASPAYNIPSVLADYVVESRLARQVFTGDKPFREERPVYSDRGVQILPEADFIVTTRLTQFETWRRISAHGTSVFLILTVGVLSGFEQGVDGEIAFALRDRDTREILLERRYTIKGQTDFYSLGGIWRLESENPFDIAADEVHSACQDFVSALDSHFPPSSESTYWNEISRNRESRTASSPTPSSPPVSPAEVATPPVQMVSSGLLQRGEPVGEGWAVLVGISTYKHAGKAGLTNLIYADKDAQDFHDLLIELGWSSSRIKLLTNEEALETEIRVAIRDWLRKAREHEPVVLYWSGHGMIDPEDPTRVYMVCHDTDPAKPSSGYRMNDIRDHLEELNARNVVVIADTCHAGKLITRSDGTKAVGNVMHENLQELPPPPGWVFMVGADADRLALEGRTWSNGAFTHVLLKGLKGQADGVLSGGEKDGIVTMHELRLYMSETMPVETEKVLGVARHPRIVTNTGDAAIWDLTLHNNP